MHLSVKNKRLRCLCVITSLPLGGAEKSLLRLVRNSSHTVDYMIISLDSRRDLESEFENIGASVINLDINNFFSAASGLFRLVRAVKTWNPDMLYYWMYHAMFFSVAVKIVCPKIPIIWGIRHNNLDLKLNKLGTVFIARILAKFSFITKKVVYCSNESSDLHFKIGYKASKSVLIENGFDYKEFTHKDSLPSAYILSLRHKYFPLVNADSILIGCCARYDPLKRFENFISTAERLIHEGCTNITFCLVGEGLPERQNQLLKDIPIKERNFFRFVGATKNIDEIFQCLDILIQTSFSESFPNVIPEAMLCGAAIIATDVGQTSHIMGSEGVLVPPDDIDSNVTALKKLLSNPEKIKFLQKKGANRVREKFGVDDLVAANIKMFREVLCAD